MDREVGPACDVIPEVNLLRGKVPQGESSIVGHDRRPRRHCRRGGRAVVGQPSRDLGDGLICWTGVEQEVSRGTTQAAAVVDGTGQLGVRQPRTGYGPDSDQRLAKGSSVKGIVQLGFGSPAEVLDLRELDTPRVEKNAVLVRVRAASIHVGDVYGIRGVPKAMRPIFRSMRAPNGVVGTDIAGTVETVGDDVVGLRPGDEVFGSAKGAFAEYALAKADALVAKPPSLTFEHAAAIGVSATTALQALRDRGKVQAGQKVLITGASGGVGTFAVQVAASLGATVTGVCSTRNTDMVRSIGADHVIDYTRAITPGKATSTT